MIGTLRKLIVVVLFSLYFTNSYYFDKYLSRFKLKFLLSLRFGM